MSAQKSPLLTLSAQFASPSIDMPYYQHQGLRVGSSLSQPPVTFDPQPNVGGLGMGMLGQQGGAPSQMYYQQLLVSYASGFEMSPANLDVASAGNVRWLSCLIHQSTAYSKYSLTFHSHQFHNAEGGLHYPTPWHFRIDIPSYTHRQCSRLPRQNAQMPDDQSIFL